MVRDLLILELFKYRYTPYGLRGKGLKKKYIWNYLTLIINLRRILSLIHQLSYGTVCPLKCVFQVMLMTSKVNCTIAAF